MIDHYWGRDQQREDGLNINSINVGHGGSQRIMHDSKMTKTCLGEFMSGGFSILKVGDTQNSVFNPNDVVPYEMSGYERDEIFNGDVKGNKWVPKKKGEIIKRLWLLQKLPEQINVKFLMLVKQIYFGKNKKSLKSKDDKNI